MLAAGGEVAARLVRMDTRRNRPSRPFVSAFLLSVLYVTPSAAQVAAPAAPRSTSVADDASVAPAEATSPRTTAAQGSSSNGVPTWEGYYLDPGRGPAPFAPEYERWFGESRRPARYARTAIELAGVLAVGTAYYWIVSDPNKQDWDYIDIRDRSLNIEVKFDNNMFRTNFLLHPLAGTMSYWFSRSNGLDIYKSSAASFLSSAMFEFLLEWLEKPASTISSRPR